MKNVPFYKITMAEIAIRTYKEREVPSKINIEEKGAIKVKTRAGDPLKFFLCKK
jgi:hypothetical protein